MSTEEQEKKLIRSFGLTNWSVNNRTTVFFLSLVIFVAGLLAYNGMPKEAFPEIVLPTIYVGTPYPGNSPDDIENLITRPLEKEINSIAGIKKISSSSIQDMSTIIVEFESDIDPGKALLEVKDAVDKTKQDLPSDLDNDPIIDDINFGEFPIMFINISGNYSLDKLKEYAELLQDMMEDVDEIREAAIRGIDEKEVKIDLDVHKLAAVELSFNDVANAISARNTTMSAGSVKRDGFVQSMKVEGEIKNIEELYDIVVKNEKQQIVYLKELLADDIVLEAKESESFASFTIILPSDKVKKTGEVFKQQATLKIDVIKESGKNLIMASDQINSILSMVTDPDYAGKLPNDLEYTVTIDQSDQTRAQVDNLENSIISGVILVVLVLLFFLGTRNSLFVGIAIPMSMLLSFVILSSLGVSINMMVLFGLIMALGMLVDNGIVVVENVYRLMDEGYSPIRAAKEGVAEVAWPIIASTATTLAAFFPLALWPGVMGEFMWYLPLTLIIVLSSSLFVALVMNPVFTSVFMRVDGSNEKGLTKTLKVVIILCGVLGVIFLLAKVIWLANLLFLVPIITLLNIYVLTPASNKFQASFLPRLENSYERFLKTALKGKMPYVYLGGTFLLMFISIGVYFGSNPKVEFFPDNEPKYVNVFIEQPLGTDIEVTKEFSLNVERIIRDVVVEDTLAIRAISTQVGKGTSDPGDPFAGSGGVSTPHKARVTVEFKDYSERGDINSQSVMNKIQNKLKSMSFPGVIVVVAKDRNGPPAGAPISMEISGDDYGVLIEQADRIIAKVNNSDIKGIEELKSDLERGKPELVLEIDYAKAGRYGISARDIASTLRTAIFGREVSKFKSGEDEYEIQVRLDEQYRNDVNVLMDQMITFRSQADGQIKQVPISALAKPTYQPAFASIKRKNLERVVSITSNVIDGYNATEIVNEIKELMVDYKMPEGYSLNFTGEQEEQAKEMNFLGGALMIALFFILLIIVAQFNKISAPLIILSSVLLSITGVFLGLVISGSTFVVIMTMMGIISLAGIVVNNAIVLLDYSSLVRDRKVSELGGEDKFTRQDLIDTIVQAGKTRLRPVILTAITTVLGLIPLAIGLNINFFGLIQRYDGDFSIGSENTIFWGPMSWTIINGIVFATFLTLILVPVMYFIVERMKVKIRR